MNAIIVFNVFNVSAKLFDANYQTIEWLECKQIALQYKVVKSLSLQFKRLTSIKRNSTKVNQVNECLSNGLLLGLLVTIFALLCGAQQHKTWAYCKTHIMAKWLKGAPMLYFNVKIEITQYIQYVCIVYVKCMAYYYGIQHLQ